MALYKSLKQKMEKQEKLNYESFQIEFQKIVDEAIKELSLNAKCVLISTHNKLYALENKFWRMLRNDRRK